MASSSVQHPGAAHGIGPDARQSKPGQDQLRVAGRSDAAEQEEEHSVGVLRLGGNGQEVGDGGQTGPQGYAGQDRPGGCDHAALQDQQVHQRRTDPAPAETPRM